MLVDNAINKSNKEKRNNFYERYIDVLKNYISVNDYHYKLQYISVRTMLILLITTTIMGNTAQST